MKRYCVSIIIAIAGLCLVGHAGLVARYTFDESTNMTIDATGNGHTLDVFSGYGTPGYSAQGKFGGAATFDGSTQGWIINDNIYPAGSFSFSAWVKPEGPITMITTPWGLTSGFNVYVASGAYRFLTYYDAGLSSFKSSTAAPVVGEWQHVVMTFEVTSGPDVDSSGTYTGTIKGYVNGVLVATLTGAQYDRATSNDMAIGRRSTSAFNGLMDEVCVYDSALTELEIQNLVILGEDPLLAHYTFDDPTNMTSDVSGNGHNLSVAVGYGTPDHATDGKLNGSTAFNLGGTASQGWITGSSVLTPSFTFAAWVKPTGESSMVVQPWSLTSGYSIYMAAGAYRVSTMSAEGTSYKITGVSPTIGSWQHIALTYAATNGPDTNGTYIGTMTAYIDGEVVGTLENAKYAAPSTGYLALGRRSTAFFNGQMDDVYLYRKALTQSEIQALVAISGPLSGYAGWAGGWGVDIGSQTNDYDGDGLSNLYEYGVGGDPTNALNQGAAPVYGLIDYGGTQYFGYAYSQLSDPASGLGYSLEVSTNLITGAWTNGGYTVYGTNITGGALNIVSNFTDMADIQKFIRLVIEEK